MTKEKLEEFKERVNEHFTREAHLFNEIYDADLTPEEYAEMNDFMENHPWAEFGNKLDLIVQQQQIANQNKEFEFTPSPAEIRMQKLEIGKYCYRWKCPYCSIAIDLCGSNLDDSTVKYIMANLQYNSCGLPEWMKDKPMKLENDS